MVTLDISKAAQFLSADAIAKFEAPVAAAQKALEEALAQAKASGEFDGPKGEKGEKGDTGTQGPAGPAGKTPEKGVDYWTADDKSAIVNDVLAALPTWEGGSY